MEPGLSDISPVELAAVASSMSDAGRAAILLSLLDGRARTASELAFVAGISPQTARIFLCVAAWPGPFNLEIDCVATV
jgi:DNA-binding transcriptional ArsR family regulator